MKMERVNNSTNGTDVNVFTLLCLCICIVCSVCVYLCHASAGAVWSGSPQIWHVCSAWAAWRGHHHAVLCQGWRGRSERNQDARSTWIHGCASWKFPRSVKAEHTHAHILQVTTGLCVCIYVCMFSIPSEDQRRSAWTLPSCCHPAAWKWHADDPPRSPRPGRSCSHCACNWSISIYNTKPNLYHPANINGLLPDTKHVALSRIIFVKREKNKVTGNIF